MTGGPLEGFTVGVTADRRGDDQAVLLARLGVEVVRGPVLRTELEAVDADLAAATHRIIAAPPDVLVANTGFGIRTWWAAATEWGLDGPLREALRTTRLVARGPKAAGALRSLGLPVSWRAPDEQLATVAAHLVETGVEGLTVDVQLHGDDDPATGDRLRSAGATVREVPVYRWTGPADGRAALELVARCCDGTIDAVTFTAGPAVRNFVALAEATGRAGPLLAALNDRMVTVCVGPVCAGVAREEGVVAPVFPEHWRLGAMVTCVGAVLAGRRWQADTAFGPRTIQGGLVVGGEVPVPLRPPARRALALLVARRGAPVALDELGCPPAELVASVPELAGAVVVDERGVRLAGRPAAAGSPLAIPGRRPATT